MPEWLGKTIGKVRIEKLLARGGMAEVYLGSHLTLERPVAVKVLHSYIEEDPILLERFQREAKVVAGLRHPNIVQIFDFDTTDGHPYIVMEYLRGPTLATYLRHLHQRKKRIPLELLARLLQQLTAALDYAHGQGVIHRDIKPGNILLHTKTDNIPLDQTLPNDVEAIVTDFGLVRVVNAASQTVSGFISGTPAYASPEQARGDQTDHRTDLYSLGVVFYEMLAGKIPFEADNTVTILHMHLHMNPAPIPGISPKVQAVVDRALRKNPDERYQSSQEMAIDFYRAIGMTVQADAIPVIESRVSAEPVEEPSEGAVSWLPKPELLPTPAPPTVPPKPAPIESEPAPTVLEPKSQPAPIIPEPATKPQSSPFEPEPAPQPKPAPIAREPSSKPARNWAWIGAGFVSLVIVGVIVAWALGIIPRGPSTQPTQSNETLPATANPSVPAASATPSLPDGTNMVQIPAGTYTIGKDPADNNHVASQKIELNSFWIDQYQTTNADYLQYVAETNALAPKVVPNKPNQEKHPVRGVTWNQANDYCQWRNKRLPTEAEWEAAGRGSDKFLYPWGNDKTFGGKTIDLPSQDTYEVGTYSFNKSPFGVFDMLGNVWEWVGEPYPNSNTPAEKRILHGSNFGNDILDLAFRVITAPDDTRYLYDAGFRCAAAEVR